MEEMKIRKRFRKLHHEFKLMKQHIKFAEAMLFLGAAVIFLVECVNM